RIVDAWQGLTMNEGLVASAIKQTVLEGIDEGLLIGEQWLDGTSFDAILDALSDVSGSKEEQGLTAEILRPLFWNLPMKLKPFESKRRAVQKPVKKGACA
ncbi:MAG: hypothetical protein L7U25_03240, partial [Candidatus Poseidonia sp.]|nr:hypothetical protein [Poseidonia sp.]